MIVVSLAGMSTAMVQFSLNHRVAPRVVVFDMRGHIGTCFVVKDRHAIGCNRYRPLW